MSIGSNFSDVSFNYIITSVNTLTLLSPISTSIAGDISIPPYVIYNDISYNINSIGNDAFLGCSGLTAITIPVSVTTIGASAFLGCSGLTSIYYSGLQPSQYFIDLGAPSNVNIIRPFYVFFNKNELITAINLYTSNLELAISTYGDINTWIVTLITDMSELFMEKYTFNYDISNWDVSNVTNMSGMFQYAEGFDQPLNNWVVSNVTNMSSMFNGAIIFNQPLNNWNVSNVTDMMQMFYNARLFNNPLNQWNVGKVINMKQMFGGGIQLDSNNIYYSAFNQPLDSWNVANVTDMSQMFYTSSYNQPLNSWNVANVTIMTNMFTSCLFNQELNNWNVAKVDSFYGMFAGNKVFNKDIRTWTVKSSANLQQIFTEATAFNAAYTLNPSNPSYLFFNYKMLYLNQGWNIIGTSYNSTILDASAIIHTNTIYSMNKGVYSKPITNRQLESTKGYFIKTINPGYIMSQDLTNFNESYIDVNVGWNLIGVSQDSAILDPSNVIISNSIYTLDSSNNSQIVTDNILYTNKGYFLKSTMDKRLFLQKIIYMSDISNNFSNTISDYQKLIFDISYNIQPNTTLTISSKANFEVNTNSTIQNNGRIENYGTIENSGIIVNNDTMINRGYIHSTGGTTVQNYERVPTNGAIVNTGNITFAQNNVDIGALFNKAGSNFTNFSNSSIGYITNDTNFTNRGTLNSTRLDNRGSVTNNGGTMNVSIEMLLYTGTFTSMNNSILTFGEMTNTATFNNNDSILNITYRFNNFGSSAILNNNINGTINSNLFFNNTDGAQINNAGSFINNGAFNNTTGGLITNTGSISGPGTFTNYP